MGGGTLAVAQPAAELTLDLKVLNRERMMRAPPGPPRAFPAPRDPLISSGGGRGGVAR